MATILVVDDSLADRRLIANLLAKDTELHATFASDGQEALLMMSQQEPDLVLTDLRMPRMDGLELVANIRQKHPLVPVILMTSQGSEDIAVQSLRRGASSYVPKRALAQDLVRTIRGLLDLAYATRSRTRVLQTVSESRTTYVLNNDYYLISDVVNHVEDQLRAIDFGDDNDCIRISVALTEALSNALYHGNLEMDSEMREEDFEAYLALARERAGREPYCRRKIRLRAYLSKRKVELAVSDDGRGFDPNMLPDPTSSPNLEKVTGRGIMLMRTLMDKVEFGPVGKRVKMLKLSPLSPARKSKSQPAEKPQKRKGAKKRG